MRPAISLGNLVKLNKNPKNINPKFLRKNANKTFKVIKITKPMDEVRKLGLDDEDFTISGSEGFLLVTIEDKEGRRYLVRRRQIWRVPNQPKVKSKSEYVKPVDETNGAEFNFDPFLALAA